MWSLKCDVLDANVVHRVKDNEVEEQHQSFQFKKGLNNTLRHRMGFLGSSVQGQELDLKILMRPLQFNIFYDKNTPSTAVSKGISYISGY